MKRLTLVPDQKGAIIATFIFQLPTEGTPHMTLSGQRMRRWSGRRILAATGMAVAGLIGAALAAAQTAPQEKPLMAEQVFKNVQALKGIPVDDFLETMGIMAAALQFDCSDCHVGAGTDKVDWAADTPRKRMARTMVNMVATINRTNFGGRQMVTCWTCHRNRDKPLVTPVMATIYGTPAYEPDDISATLKARLINTHGIAIKRRTTEEMTQALRVYDKENRIIYLSEALDYSNVLFQLAHVLCLIELQDLLNKLTAGSKITAGTSLARCHVELANYFAAAYLMPYQPFLREAESMAIHCRA